MRFRPSALVVYLTARHMLTVLVVALCLAQSMCSTVDVATALAIALATFVAGRVVFQAEGETHFDLGGPCAVAAVLLLPPPLCVAALGPSLALAHLIKWGRQTEWPKRESAYLTLVPEWIDPDRAAQTTTCPHEERATRCPSCTATLGSATRSHLSPRYQRQVRTLPNDGTTLVII